MNEIRELVWALISWLGFNFGVEGWRSRYGFDPDTDTDSDPDEHGGVVNGLCNEAG